MLSLVMRTEQEAGVDERKECIVFDVWNLLNVVFHQFFFG